jgi:prophage tail gpP-like protein
MSINRGIDAVCGSFELGITIREKTGGVVFPVKTGMSCQVTLGGVPQVTGRIDSVSRSLSAEDWSIKIAGRDKAADLADCSAINSPGSWSNAKLETIAKAIAAPFGISIDVAAHWRGVPEIRAPARRDGLGRDRADGALSRPDRLEPGRWHHPHRQPDSGTITGQVVEGVNLISADATDDASQRFSRYIVRAKRPLMTTDMARRLPG